MLKSLISTNMPIPTLHYLFFFILFTSSALMNQTDSARNLDDHPKHALHPHQQISFSMPSHNIHTQTRPNAAHYYNNLPPFSKPLGGGGYFPPVAGIPYNPEPGVRQPQTLDLGGLTLSFPAAATLRELELGTVAAIDEEVYSAASVLVGKAEGVYVAASSGDGSSHMMAMTASFVGSDRSRREYEDGLRFFGVLKNDAEEFHLAVIGGTGRYDGANGYATVKPLNISGSTSLESGDGSYKILHFNVYLG